MNKNIAQWIAVIVMALAAGTAGAANYTNTASGNWIGGSWTPSAPVSTTDGNNVIVFNPSATDNSTNDFTGAFWLNQLLVVPNTNVNLYAPGGNSLLFTNTTGGILPGITNAGTSNLTINSAITLATNLTIGVASSGAITITSNITNGALGYGITKTGSGTLTLSGSNTFSGGLTLTGGGTTWLRDNTMNLGAVMLNKGNNAGNVLNLTNVTLTSGDVTIGNVYNNGDSVNLNSNNQWNASRISSGANVNGQLYINGGATVTVTNGVSWTAAWTAGHFVLNGGSLVISNCSQAVYLNETQSRISSIIISNGTLIITPDSQ